LCPCYNRAPGKRVILRLELLFYLPVFHGQ